MATPTRLPAAAATGSLRSTFSDGLSGSFAGNMRRDSGGETSSEPSKHSGPAETKPKLPSEAVVASTDMPHNVETPSQRQVIDAMQGSVALNAAAGAIAGGSVLMAVFPIDSVKTHMQARGTSLPNTLSSLVSRGGVGSLYRGFSPAMAEHALNRGILFGLGSVIKKKLPDSWAEPVRDAASGGGAALFKTVMLHPADTIKCRWQLGQPRSELGGLYQGFGPAAMRSSVGMAIWLSVRNALERALQPSDPAEGPLISYRQFISGATASVVTDLCTFPLDTVKKNLQAAPSSARFTMSDMVTRLFADGGLRRFYVGYTPRLVMVSINGALFNVSLVVSKWLLAPIFPEE